MKKNIVACILVIAMLLSVGATAVFAENTAQSLVEDINIDRKDISSSQDPFEFPITPNSKEWGNYSSVQLKEMLNIPLSTAEKMDTAALLKMVLEYPFMIDIYAYDTIEQGFKGLSLEFNGAAVLLQRPDLAKNLLTHYKNSTEKMLAVETKSHISDKEIIQKMFMESLLLYPKVSDKLSEDEKHIIVTLSQQVSDKFQISPLVVGEASVTAAAPGDVLGYGYVYTPAPPVTVLVLKLQDFDAEQKKVINNDYDTRYPAATRLSSATYNYNCHSYAWYLASSSNPWWMNDPSAYMSESRYTQVTNPIAGDKVYWIGTHSGLVTSVSGSNITVTSKWGAAGLYRHPINDCPYPIVIQKTFWR